MLQLKNTPGFARNNLVMTHSQHKQIGQHRNAHGFLTAVGVPADLVFAQPQARFEFPVHELHRPAFLVDARSSATSSSSTYPVRRSIKINIICSKNVSSTAPMISRTSAPAHASCSQSCAVSSNAVSTACMTPRKAEGEDPTCVSRWRRVKNSLNVSRP